MNYSDNMFSLVMNKICSELSIVELLNSILLVSLLFYCVSLLFLVYLPHALVNKVDNYKSINENKCFEW